jgi:hypothetical protein
MHLHTKAEELASEIQEEMNETTDEGLKQAYNDCYEQAKYLSTRLKELGSD